MNDETAKSLVIAVGAVADSIQSVAEALDGQMGDDEDTHDKGVTCEEDCHAHRHLTVGVIMPDALMPRMWDYLGRTGDLNRDGLITVAWCKDCGTLLLEDREGLQQAIRSFESTRRKLCRN